MSESEDSKAQALKGGIPRAVALEGRAIAVKAIAVDLDDQARDAPEEVDFVLGDADVDLRLREAVVAAQAQEDPLQLAASEIRLGHSGGSDQAEVECSP